MKPDTNPAPGINSPDSSGVGRSAARSPGVGRLCPRCKTSPKAKGYDYCMPCKRAKYLDCALGHSRSKCRDCGAAKPRVRGQLYCLPCSATREQVTRDRWLSKNENYHRAYYLAKKSA